MIKLNETPVRTSRNFNINNIKIEDIEIPKIIEEFSNIDIIKESENIDVNSNVKNFNLTYGLGNYLTNLVNEKSNLKLKLEISDKSKKTNRINFNFDDENMVLFENIEIIAKEDSKSTIILKYETDNEEKYLHNGIIKVIAKENSNLDIIIVNFMNINSNNFISIENTIETNAKVNYTIVDFGGKNSITNYYSNLIGENSDNNLNTIYLGRENQLFDLNYIGELRGEKSNINIDVQGALKDVAKKHFKGTIDFKKGCKKAKGNENENCMLLSDTAKSISLPMLLCSEEDIDGNHSCSAGKIGEKELFYIMSRGFELKAAMKLIVRAKFNKILEGIKDEELKESVFNEIDRRLS